VVLDRRVALHTLDIAFGNVHAMQTRRVVILIEDFRVVVTVDAARFFRMTVPVRHLLVAGDARDEILDVLWVVHDKPRRRDHARRRTMACYATGRKVIPFPFLEMAEEACARGDREMVALDDLGMTTRATELLAATELPEVLRVVEPHPSVVDHSLHLSKRMTPRSQARGIFDFRPRLRRPIRPRDVLHDLVCRLKLPHGLRFDTRRVVTFDALHFTMRRCRPRLIIRLHVVAFAAETRLRAVFDEADGANGRNYDEQHANLDENLQRARETSPNPSERYHTD